MVEFNEEDKQPTQSPLIVHLDIQPDLERAQSQEDCQRVQFTEVKLLKKT